MMTLSHVPQTLAEVKEVYGDPDPDGDFVLDGQWYENFTQVYRLPFPMSLYVPDGKPVNWMRCHKLVGEVIQDALEDVCNYGGLSYLQEHSYDVFGGCFSFRKMVGGSLLSTHSWGIAIDINPQLGLYLGEDNQPQFIKDAFEKRGFVNLERDTMHFMACACYWR